MKASPPPHMAGGRPSRTAAPVCENLRLNILRAGARKSVLQTSRLNDRLGATTPDSSVQKSKQLWAFFDILDAHQHYTLQLELNSIGNSAHTPRAPAERSCSTANNKVQQPLHSCANKRKLLQKSGGKQSDRNQKIRQKNPRECAKDWTYTTTGSRTPPSWPSEGYGEGPTPCSRWVTDRWQALSVVIALSGHRPLALHHRSTCPVARAALRIVLNYNANVFVRTWARLSRGTCIRFAAGLQQAQPPGSIIPGFNLSRV
jgi:hypothetical protein